MKMKLRYFDNNFLVKKKLSSKKQEVVASPFVIKVLKYSLTIMLKSTSFISLNNQLNFLGNRLIV